MTNSDSNPLKHRPRKRFGQNFLTDTQIIHEIICCFAPRDFEHVVEIGPGKGALTEHLADKTQTLTLVELDRDLADHLHHRFHQKNNIQLLQQDALKLDLSQIQQKIATQSKLRIIGNLPYNISSPLLFHLIDQIHNIEDMVFMLQKEVVDRITAQPGNKDYGKLSIMCQYFLQTQCLLEVPPTAFEPAPKVTSAVLHARPHPKPTNASCDVQILSNLVSAAFQQRRKQIRNTLAAYFNHAELETLGIDSTLRAENLSIATYIRLANAYRNKHPS